MWFPSYFRASLAFNDIDHRSHQFTTEKSVKMASLVLQQLFSSMSARARVRRFKIPHRLFGFYYPPFYLHLVFSVRFTVWNNRVPSTSYPFYCYEVFYRRMLPDRFYARLLTVPGSDYAELCSYDSEGYCTNWRTLLWWKYGRFFAIFDKFFHRCMHILRLLYVES